MQHRESSGGGHTAVFLTIITHKRLRILDEPAAAWLLLDCMVEAEEQLGFDNLAHVILPDHFHWLIRPADGSSSRRIVGVVKRNFSQTRRQFWTGGDGRVKTEPWAGTYWQKKIYDHAVRDARDFHTCLDYIHYNPVKHGLAETPACYPFSSFRNWCNRGVYSHNWGTEMPVHLDNLLMESPEG